MNELLWHKDGTGRINFDLRLMDWADQSRKFMTWIYHAFLVNTACYGVSCVDTVHILTGFYDSQQSEHRPVLMCEWSSWGSRQAAQMGFDGRVARWTLPWVRRRPLSRLYCPAQTTQGLITGSEEEGGGHYVPEVLGGGVSLSTCHGSTNGNSALIHWSNQSQANMNASSGEKARDVWHRWRCHQLKWQQHAANRGDRSGSSWIATLLPQQARSLMLHMVHKFPELHLYV